MSKFENFAFNLAQDNGRAVSKRRFHWRLATPEDSLRLTGYVNNAGLPSFQCAISSYVVMRFAVAPIGFQDKSLKVIVCAAILRLSPGYIWMGAGFSIYLVCRRSSYTCPGDIDLKLGCSVEEFILRTGAYVGDMSDGP